MLRNLRHSQILDLIRSKGSVEVSQISRAFGVSEVTIRRDLDDLANRKQILRTHGGGVLTQSQASSETPLDARLSEHREEKEAIARYAISMIREGQKVFLDSGSTLFCVARLMDNSKRVTVVTNALNVATELNLRTNVSVISVGGDLRKNTFSCVGYFAEEMVAQLTLDCAFLGVGGITPDGHLCEVSALEVAVKRAVIRAAKQVVVLADHSKIGVKEFARTASLKDIDVLVTDVKAPKELCARYRKMGVDVHTVEPKQAVSVGGSARDECPGRRRKSG